MRSAASTVYRVATTLLGWILFVSSCLVWGVFVIPPTLLISGVWPSVRDRFNELTSGVLRLYVRSLLFVRIHVEGGGHRLQGPRIVVANHQSWLDPIVMISLEPGLSGPARRYMFRVPIVRTILRIAGFYPTDAQELLSLEPLQRSAGAARERGSGLLFFPEGTRSRSGDIGPFHRGAFRAAVDHALPIQPVVIDGLDRVLPPGHLIAQTAGRFPVRIRYLAPIEPPFGSGIRRDVVRALSERVRASLVDELARLRAEHHSEPDACEFRAE